MRLNHQTLLAPCLLALLSLPTIADDPPREFGNDAIATVSQTDIAAQRRLTNEYQREVPVDRYKSGVLQTASVSTGWLAGLSSNELNSSFLELSLQAMIPLGRSGRILGVTPSFRTDYIDAAPGIESPSELHEAGVSFYLPHKFNEKWSVTTVVAPSVRSDFTTSDNAFRVFGLALFNWQAKPDRLAVSFGILYPDRADLPILPAFGLTWTPNIRTVYDVRFPESRFSWRFAKDGCRSESWAYLSGGFGGSTWAVTRVDGSHDELSLKDVRLLLGAEHLLNGGSRLFVEAGVAFSRTLEYEVTQSEQSFGNAALIQAGLTY